MPLGAQNDVKDAEFGTITCKGITVAGPYIDESTMLIPGNVMMSSSGGLGVHIFSNGKSGYLSLGDSVNISGGSKEVDGGISVSGENGDAGLDITELGGRVYVSDSDSDPRAVVKVNEYGGVIGVSSKDDTKGADIGIAEHGGMIGVYAEDGKQAAMRIEAHGGRVDVYSKGSDTTRATIGVNEYGNGAVSTWDKNGYSLATLK